MTKVSLFICKLCIRLSHANLFSAIILNLKPSREGQTSLTFLFSGPLQFPVSESITAIKTQTACN